MYLDVRRGADDGLRQGGDAALGEVVERRVRLVRFLFQSTDQTINRERQIKTRNPIFSPQRKRYESAEANDTLHFL